MTNTTLNFLKTAVFGVILATLAFVANATTPTLTYGNETSPTQNGRGGSYQIKLANDKATLYSFEVNSRFNSAWNTLKMVDGSITGATQKSITATSYYQKLGSYYKYTTSKFGGKKLLYIYNNRVYFIEPSAPFSDSYTNSGYRGDLVPTDFVVTYNLSQFPDLNTASHVHLNENSLMYLSGSKLYSLGNVKEGGVTPNTVALANNIAEVKSFGEFLFVRDTSNVVSYVGGANQNALVTLPGETNLDFLKSTYTYISNLNTIRKVNQANSQATVLTLTSTSLPAPESESASTIVTLDSKYTDYHAAAYTTGKVRYLGSNVPGGWLIDTTTGNLVSTSTAYGTTGSAGESFLFTCIDSASYPIKSTSFNNLGSAFGGFSNYTASHLGGYGDMSVAMLEDGTIRFAGSATSDKVYGYNGGSAMYVIGGGGYHNPVLGYVNADGVNREGFCGAIQLPIALDDGPKNVVATKGVFNNKVAVTWDSMGTGATYTVKRGYGASSSTIATNTLALTFDDTLTTGGATKSSPMNYQVFANIPIDVYTFVNGSKYTATSSNYGGCAFNAAYTEACSGWRASAPSAFTTGSYNLVSDVASQVLSASGFSVTDNDTPYDSFTYITSSTPLHGTVATSGGQFLYTPETNYVGADSVNFTVTDKAGNTKTSAAILNVNCQLPTIDSITLPASFNGYITQTGSFKYTAKSCSSTLAAGIKVFNKTTGVEVTSAAASWTGQPVGTAVSKNIFLVDMAPGSYQLVASIASERAGITTTNVASSTYDFTVNGMGTYTLGLTGTVFTEDDSITATVTGSAGSCTLKTQVAAKSSNDCYVEWPVIPFYVSTLPTAGSINGSASKGTMLNLSADLFKYDSNQVAHKFSSLSTQFNVLPGAITTLKPITISTVTRLMDLVKFSFEKTSGYACTIYTNAADALTAANQGKKSCLLEITLPPSMSWTTDAIPTVIGRVPDTMSPLQLVYKLSKYFSSKNPELMIEDFVNIPFQNIDVTVGISANKPSYVANSSSASIDAVITSHTPNTPTICTLSNDETASASAYETNVNPVCFVEWVTIPVGMVADQSPTQTIPRITGIPTVIGDNAIKYNVWAIVPNGLGGTYREYVSNYDGSISVTAATPATVTIETPTEGKILLSGDTIQRLLVSDNGSLGTFTIHGGDYSTIKFTISETGNVPIVFTGLKDGDVRTVSINSGDKGAWLSRTLTFKLEYEDAAVATPLTLDVIVVEEPSKNVAIGLSQPVPSPTDLDPFNLVAKIGVMNASNQLIYTAAKNGVWSATLYAKQTDNSLVAVTTPVLVDSLGNATFTGLLYKDFVGKNLVAKAVWVKPLGSTLTIDDREIVSPTSLVLNFTVCNLPTINSITLPASFASYITQPAQLNYTAQTCASSLSISTKLVDKSNGTTVTSSSVNLTGEPVGTNKNKNLYFIDLPPGSYRLDVTIESEKAVLKGTNFASKSTDFVVNDLGTFNLNIAKTIYTEDELITAVVTGSVGSCPINNVISAKTIGSCYIDWVENPFYSSSLKNDTTLEGYAIKGSDIQISGDIYKFDSNMKSHKITNVSNSVSVLPGLTTTLKPIAFTKTITRWMDLIKFSFERDTGFDCKIFTNTTDATNAANLGAKTCLLEATLPSGLAWATGTVSPTVVGRTDSAESNLTIHYKFSKYFAKKSSELMIENDVVIPLQTATFVPNVKLSKPTFVANGTPAIIDAEITSVSPSNATMCTLTNSEPSAGNAYPSQAIPLCFVEWNVIPNGLAVEVSGTSIPRLKGMLATIGDHSIKYSIYVIKTVGTSKVRENVGEYNGTIIATDVTPMSVSIQTPVEGTITLDGDITPSILVGDSGILGDVVISGGDFSTMKLSVVETGFAPQVFTGLKNGDKKTISLASGAKGAWINRNVSFKIEYEEIPLATQVTFPVKVVQLPAQKVGIFIAQPLISPNDIDPFQFTARFGIPGIGAKLGDPGQISYDPVTDGTWKAGLYVKQGMTLVAISTEVLVDADGNAVFTNLNYNDYVGQEIWAKAKWVKPVGSSMPFPDKEVVSATSLIIKFVWGGAIHADTILSKLPAEVPFKQTLDINITAAIATSLKSVNWFVSTDNVTFEPLGVSGRGATFIFEKGGVYYIKGQIVNKYSNVTSWSNTATFTASQKYSLILTGANLFLPGQPAEFSLVVNGKTGLPATEYNVVWDVIDAAQNVVSYTDVNSITVTSPLPATFDIKVRVKPKGTTAIDPKSWTETTKKLQFFTAKNPTVYITGPRTVEAGKVGKFTASVAAPWNTKLQTNLNVAGKWILPDGTEIPDVSSINFTPIATDGEFQTLTYKSWVIGLEKETIATSAFKISILSYIFPKFKLSTVVDSIYAPAYVKISLVPDTAFDAAQLKNKKFFFTWTAPKDNFSGAPLGSLMRGVADRPGTYDFSVEVKDERDNSQVLNYSLTLESTRPIILSMTLTPALKFNRQPMSFFTKPILTGGHPKDRVKSSILSIDGVESASVVGFPKFIVVPTSGEHVIGLKTNTTMGYVAETTTTVVVNENQLPVCAIDEAWNKARNYARLTPRCSDTDGRIKKYVWFVNDVQVKASSMSLYVVANADVPTSTIKLQVTDDSGGMTELTHVVNFSY